MTGYFGSKGGAGVYQAIIAAMPPHEIYIETHLGGGAIMCNKPWAQRSIGIDIDADALKKHHSDPRRHYEIYQCDAIKFLTEFDFSNTGRVLVYSDPPYLLSTRTSSVRYKYDYAAADHLRLIEFLKRLATEEIAVMISGYPSKLYDDHLPWRSIEFQAMTRGGPRTEKLWMSFEGGKAYSHKFAGKNFTDRQRIKRKAERWRRKFEALPETERVAILAELLRDRS